jgi:hypothetical protein
MQFKAGRSTVYPSVLALRGERKRREAAKLPPPEPPPRIEPPRVTPPAAALEIEPSEPMTPPAVRPPSDPKSEPSPSDDIAFPVEIVFAPAGLHVWAKEQAESYGMSLADWIVEVLDRMWRDAG